MRDFAAFQSHIRQLNERLAGLVFRVNELEQSLTKKKKQTTGGLPRRSLIHEALADVFDAGELRGFAYLLNIDYDALGGQGLIEKALNLALYMQRRGRWRELIQRLKQERPHVAWDDYA